MRYLVALVLLGACLVACGPSRVVQTPRGPVIDGWPVGEAGCPVLYDCDGVVDVAIAGLAARDGIRADPGSVTLHGYRQDEDGIFRSGGPPIIAVFELGGQGVRAIGVKLYPQPAPARVIDFGP